MAVIQGFDVSHWQGNQNWSNLKRDYGVDFGFAKALQGESSRDSEFADNWASMQSAGIVRGAYYFAEPDNNPLDDASAFLNLVNPSGADDLLVLDLESSTIGSATPQWACDWGDEITRLTGGDYCPGLYCGGYMDLTSYKDLPNHFGWWWYPRYPNKYANKSTWPTSFADCIPPDPNVVWPTWPPDIWQFSQSFPTNQGGVHDGNIFNGDVAKMRTLNDRSTGADDTPPAAEVAAAVWQYLINTGWQPDGSYSSTGVQVAMSKVNATTYGEAVQVNNGVPPQPEWHSNPADTELLSRKVIDVLPVGRRVDQSVLVTAIKDAFRLLVENRSP